MSNLLYSHKKGDLINAVRVVVSEVMGELNVNPLDNNTHLSEELMTQKECAKYLGVTVATLINWRKKKKLPYLKFGERIFYSKERILKHFKK